MCRARVGGERRIGVCMQGHIRRVAHWCEHGRQLGVARRVRSGLVTCPCAGGTCGCLACSKLQVAQC